MSVNEINNNCARIDKSCYEPPDLWIGGLLAKAGREIFAEVIDRLLEASGHSGAELARAIGVNPSMITHWRNYRSPPNLDQLEKIAEFFGVPLADLVSDPTDPRVTGMDLNTAIRMVNEAVKDKLKS